MLSALDEILAGRSLDRAQAEQAMFQANQVLEKQKNLFWSILEFSFQVIFPDGFSWIKIVDLSMDIPCGVMVVFLVSRRFIVILVSLDLRM